MEQQKAPVVAKLILPDNMPEKVRAEIERLVKVVNEPKEEPKYLFQERINLEHLLNLVKIYKVKVEIKGELLE